MNALVGVGGNAAGLLSANRTKRMEMLMQVQSFARARILGAAEEKAVDGVATEATSKSGATAKSGAAKAKETDDEDVASQELDRDAFLTLLVTQMQNQDPTAPMDNSQMIAQLAQFSSLEQMENLNDSFTALSGNVDQLNFINANTLIGRQISGYDVDGELISGVVDRVHLDGSVVYLTVNDKLVSMAGVGAIGSPDATTD